MGFIQHDSGEEVWKWDLSNMIVVRGYGKDILYFAVRLLPQYLTFTLSSNWTVSKFIFPTSS